MQRKCKEENESGEIINGFCDNLIELMSTILADIIIYERERDMKILRNKLPVNDSLSKHEITKQLRSMLRDEEAQNKSPTKNSWFQKWFLQGETQDQDVYGINNSLRITIGKSEENRKLIFKMKKILNV